MRVGDVTVGNVTKIERQGWHALVTMTLNGDVDLPANATATLGPDQPAGLAAHRAGAADRRSAAGQAARRFADPAVARRRLSDHRTDAGGGVDAAQRRRARPVQDITEAFSTAFAGRENDLRSLIGQLDLFIGYVNDQNDDIIAATESLNNLVGQFAEQKPVVDKALETIPDALAVLNDERDNLAEALDQLGKFSALAADSVNQTKEQSGQGTQRPRPGAGIAGQRRPGADPVAEPSCHLPVPEGDPRATGCAATTPT